jgi:hypothetical protein
MPRILEPEGMHFGFVGLYLFFSLYLLVRRRKEVATEWRVIKIDRPHELKVPMAPAESPISTGRMNSD